MAEQLGTALQKLLNGCDSRPRLHTRGWWNGIHERLKISCPQGLRVQVPPLAPNRTTSYGWFLCLVQEQQANCLACDGLERAQRCLSSERSEKAKTASRAYEIFPTGKILGGQSPAPRTKQIINKALDK